MEIGLDHLGGVALLECDGFAMPVPIAVGISDAAQLFHAAGERAAAGVVCAVQCCAVQCLHSCKRCEGLSDSSTQQAAGGRVRRLVEHSALPCLPPSCTLCSVQSLSLTHLHTQHQPTQPTQLPN